MMLHLQKKHIEKDKQFYKRQIMEVYRDIKPENMKFFDGANKIEISVDYSKGGFNYWTDVQEPRGVYLHVGPVSIQDNGNYTVKGFVSFSGDKYCILELKRASKKQLERAEKAVWTYVDELAEQFQKYGQGSLGNIVSQIMDEL